MLSGAKGLLQHSYLERQRVENLKGVRRKQNQSSALALQVVLNVWEKGSRVPYHAEVPLQETVLNPHPQSSPD